MPTPSSVVYRKLPEGYKKWPNQYTVCPSCGAIKSKRSEPLCINCKAAERANRIEQPSDPSYRFIPLTKNQVAVVDTDDYGWISRWRWQAHRDRKTGHYYAYRKSRSNKKTTTVWMHREILGLSEDDLRQGDHVDTEDTLNNRRYNLRVASQDENQRNKNVYKNSKSGLKGVHLSQEGAYIAQIRYEGKQHYLGSFRTAEEAYAIYCAAAIEHHGEFARFS